MKLCWLMLLPATLFGQTLGTITGVVNDASGAAVARAQVAIKNMETNVVRSVTTNEGGNYNVPALNPGMYEIRVESTGFKTMTRSNVELQVQQTARVDFNLDVGQVTETVEVAASAQLLTTENAT